MTRHAPRPPRRSPAAVPAGPTLAAQKTLTQWRAEYRAHRIAMTSRAASR